MSSLWVKTPKVKCGDLIYKGMAKSKNSSQHNQTYKDHRNGIKGIKWNRHSSNKGVNQKLLRNLRRARKFDPKILKEKNLTKRIEVLRKNKDKIIQAIKEKKAPKAAPAKSAAPVPAKAAPAKAK
jgi:large subunit ribosomal protein L29e